MTNTITAPEISTDIKTVMQQSAKAFDEYKRLPGSAKASFLEEIAAQIELKREQLVAIANQESNLPLARLNGELTRTTNQLKLFAEVIREGSWVEAAIDEADGTRTPARPDIRKMLVALGPVVVFGASNFPFAFSTAGGDTASALAAGCSVVIKAHPAHAQTSLLVYEAIQKAIAASGVPEHTVQHVEGKSNETGKALVQHPATAGVGFTGSFAGGKALQAYSNEREKPVPVFAEMSSINPVVFYPAALQSNAAALAQQYAGSITLGMGQFCTNPGLLLAVKGQALDNFLALLSTEIKKVTPQKMLHSGICQAYNKGLHEMLEEKGIDVLAQSEQKPEGLEAYPTLAKVSAATFLDIPHFKEELFGPFSLVIECSDMDELKQVLLSLHGQLTTTAMATQDDLSSYADVLELQKTLAGRIIINAAPTGVEVCAAMVHGGPYPATTDARFTSVGTSAIKRWARPLCFQGFPDALLPPELQQANPLGIVRIFNNKYVAPAK
ncbi:aldehyde dehydrogenase (NADP(+)) [Foetidibacter luteolus]|uniref:aldehyde dehydrogenase (NADP(+)) n=1 Tax=Foetidibacter luteolus TaxID=2608880 RepID=UPI00129B1372|nr:aldehyde dehydrogenase (NADP(+)) [Foetidibacter luteolus]